MENIISGTKEENKIKKNVNEGERKINASNVKVT